MSITLAITIWCDEPHCLQWVQHETSSSREARREVSRRCGWSYRRSDDGGYVDLCQGHSVGHNMACNWWVGADCTCGVREK